MRYLIHGAKYAASVLAFSMLWGCSTSQNNDPPPEAFNVSSPGRSAPSLRSNLAVGDQVEVFVMEDESFNGVYRVREAGDVILPRIGRVKIVDLTAKSAESAIRAVLEKSQLAKATVIVDRVSLSNESSAAGGPRAQIYLTGSVNRPGLHQMVIPDGGLGVYEAIMIGGGANRFGDERKVTIIRRSKGAARNQYTVDLTRIRSGQSKDVPIQDGDIIMVPERKFIL